jgi:hypothetical protein
MDEIKIEKSGNKFGGINGGILFYSPFRKIEKNVPPPRSIDLKKELFWLDRGIIECPSTEVLIFFGQCPS